MKKKIGEINGLLLSNKQMKELKGGTAWIPQSACGTKCSVNATYICALNAMDKCVCGGSTGNNGFSVGECTK
jgi:hypothetical protein